MSAEDAQRQRREDAPMTEQSPYLHPSHLAYVAEGRCDSISPTKAWCGDEPGHVERLNTPHHAPTLLPNGKVDKRLYTWMTEWPRPVGNAEHPST